MAVALGTNSGFVTVAPTADPAGGNVATVDNSAVSTHDTSPSDASRIVEVGWYDSTAGTEEANFEVGLYAADGAVVPGEAGTRLFVSATNAKGTSAGWHRVTVDWAISPSTQYWLALQVDNTATATQVDIANAGGTGRDTKASQSTLTNPFSGGALSDADGMVALYALYESAGPTYTVDATVGTFALTGISLSTLYHRVLALSAGALTLTGIDSIITRTRVITAAVAQFILTGIDAILRYSNPFTNEQKHSTSFTNITKNATSMTNQTKNATSFTNVAKEDGTTFTNQSKNATTFTNTDKS